MIIEITNYDEDDPVYSVIMIKYNGRIYCVSEGTFYFTNNSNGISSWVVSTLNFDYKIGIDIFADEISIGDDWAEIWHHQDRYQILIAPSGHKWIDN